MCPFHPIIRVSSTLFHQTYPPYLSLSDQMEQHSDAKWEAKVSATLKDATVDQIWPLFKDFFNFHRWFPTLATCHGIHGANGEPGCIRYCSGFSIPSKSGEKSVSWSKERLIAVDDADHSLSYEIVESNIGFNSYVATFRIVPRGDIDGRDGCVIEWSITVDPVEGWVFGDLVRKYEAGLQKMSNRIEDAICI
ncbi:lachrymatory-factor synthase-like [Pyrus x bretschneideri]|uniref:lachrymatory-factor synthase-like n=1 Tax=Pyrus x bretschneideri TaxID=225117 RepID=UPI00202F3152|nr:lachrymatory-factor synthase-like [Pyrus x bretschneideri]